MSKDIIPRFFDGTLTIDMLQLGLDWIQVGMMQVETHAPLLDQLTGWQDSRVFLDRTMYDHTSVANVRVARWDQIYINMDGTYRQAHEQASIYYNSDEFREGRERAKYIKRKIINLHRMGITNERSFKEGGILKTLENDFPNHWAQPYRKWRNDLSLRIPSE